MAEFISDYFGKDFDAVGVFDAVMDSDSHYFINVTRLKDTTTPEFLESYSKINSYFHEIALLLSFANEKNTQDRFYKEALKKFSFSEINGINLGFSESRYGAAFGEVLKKAIMTSTRGHFIATPYIFIVYPYPVCTPYSLYQSFHLRNYIFYSFPSIAATIS